MFQLRHQIGDVVKDRYTIRQLLGSGAFGTVYRVEETLGARVLTLACKEMHVLSDPATAGDERGDALHMFQEEAYLLQTLRNPHIPAAYFEQEKGVWLACPVCGLTFRGVRQCPDHGNDLQVVRERYYLLMDFLDGPDLEQLLEQNNGRPLEEEPVLDWALQLCDALEVVHDHGLSHRDIKPANIKIQGPTRQAMLIDFGLVKPSNVAGAYGTVLKQGSTGLGTIGYAPESPQEQRNPDARTDILALGMTLYRLVTRRDPSDPDDLALMRRTTPGDLNLRLSESANEIILKMIQTNPDNRYGNVKELRHDLQAARYPIQLTCPHCGHVQRAALGAKDDVCARCGRPMKQNAPQIRRSIPDEEKAPPLITRPNPFEPRIRQLLEEKKTPPAPAPFRGEARIVELEAKLKEVAKQSVGHTQQCPSCHDADLIQVTGQPTGRCPLCDGTQLARRQWDPSLCAICRKGNLTDHHLQSEGIFCPVCRAAPLVEEGRRKFGIVVDLWQNCPHCKAEFDVVTGGRIKLVSAPSDPFGIAQQYGGQTLSLEEWRRISMRSLDWSECTHCHAQWDLQTDTGLKLVAVKDDPRGIGKAFLDKTLSHTDWGKLANDVPMEAGNLHCPQCQAEWDYDRDRKTLGLAKGGTMQPAWSIPLQGAPRPLPDWYFAAAGKTSAHPGPMCPRCKTEFDNDGANLKLVAAASLLLENFVGQSHSLADWQRRGAGLPVGTEAHALRAELNRLLSERQAEENLYNLQGRQAANQREVELYSLLKQSVLGGFIPIQRTSQFAPAGATTTHNGMQISLPGTGHRAHLRASENVLWESGARFHSAYYDGRLWAWTPGPDGSLIVTNERIVFNVPAQRGRPWDYALSQIESVVNSFVGDVQLVVIRVRGQDRIFGFHIPSFTLNATLDGTTYPLTFAPEELVTLLLQQINL